MSSTGWGSDLAAAILDRDSNACPSVYCFSTFAFTENNTRYRRSFFIVHLSLANLWIDGSVGIGCRTPSVSTVLKDA